MEPFQNKVKQLFIILFLALVPVTNGFSNDHDFYVGITNIDYNSQTKSIEVTMKLIAHDLEKSFVDQKYGELKLGTARELANADELLFNYINEHFLIEQQNKILEYNFIGKEVELDESLFIYLEIPNVSIGDQLIITNRILVETFPSQENICHINLAPKPITIIFNKDITSKEINLK